MTTLQSAERVIQTIDLIAKRQSVRLDEVAAELGIHKSNALRLLATLRKHGWVAAVEHRGRYELGHALIQIGTAASSNFRIEVAYRLAEQLRDLTGETVHISVSNGLSMVTIGAVESQLSLRVIHDIGQAEDMYSTAVGKAYLACQDDEHLEMILSQIEFSGHTAETITSVEPLRAEILATRLRGYARNVREADINTAAIAVALNLLGDRTHPVCLSITGPAERFAADAMEETATQMLRLVDTYRAI